MIKDHQEKITGQRPQILIIDDEPLLLEVLVMQLGLLGYATSCSTTLENAFKIIETDLSICLILTDIKLAGHYTATDLLAFVHQKTSCRPFVVLMSGSADLLYKNYPIPADELLQKPFEIKELETILKKLLS